MARTLLQAVLNNLPSTGAVSPALSATFTVADVANGNMFTATGRDILIVANTSTVLSPPDTHYLTIHSAPDSSGRLADVTNYPIAPGGFAEVTISSASLYQQTDGNIYIDADSPYISYLLTH